MELRRKDVGDVAVVEPHGRLDTASAGQLESALLAILDEGVRRFVVDFSGVELVTGAGLRVLLMIGRRLKTMGGELVLCQLGENVHEAFAVSGFEKIFRTAPTPAAALREIRQSSPVRPLAELAARLLGVTARGSGGGSGDGVAELARLASDLLHGRGPPTEPQAPEKGEREELPWKAW